MAENEELNSIDLQEAEDSQVLKDIEIPLIKNNDFYITTCKLFYILCNYYYNLCLVYTLLVLIAK